MVSKSIPINFCCLGPQRTASSWLHEVLSCHPDVCLPDGVKETMFFDDRFHKGLSWYTKLFRRQGARQVCGEIAPTYFHSVKACERLVELSPDLKIIILVRNPIERTFSLYRHHLSKGRIRIPFSQALERHPELIDTGKYSIHAKRWEDSFPPLNTMYLWQDDIKQNPQKILDDTCDFIGVKKIKIPPVANEIVNTATAPRNAYVARILSATATTLRSLALHRVVNFGRSLGLKKMYEGGATVQKLSNEQYRMLADLFEEDLVWLEQRLGRKLDDWRYSMPC